MTYLEKISFEDGVESGCVGGAAQFTEDRVSG